MFGCNTRSSRVRACTNCPFPNLFLPFSNSRSNSFRIRLFSLTQSALGLLFGPLWPREVMFGCNRRLPSVQDVRQTLIRKPFRSVFKQPVKQLPDKAFLPHAERVRPTL